MADLVDASQRCAHHGYQVPVQPAVVVIGRGVRSSLHLDEEYPEPVLASDKPVQRFLDCVEQSVPIECSGCRVDRRQHVQCEPQTTDLIVTGDQAMLRLGEYKGIRIVTLREYLKP